MSTADPNRVILTGREPVHPAEREGRRPQHDRCQLLAHHLLPGRAGPRALSQERADGEPLAHLRPTTSRWRAGCSRPSRACSTPSCAIPAIPVIDAEFGKAGDPRDFWTERVVGAGRGDRAHLARDRRAAADPHPAERDAGAPLRRVHGADPGARRAPVAQRRPGRGPALAARARGPTVQHLRAGLLGELDRHPIEPPRARDGRRMRLHG